MQGFAVVRTTLGTLALFAVLSGLAPVMPAHAAEFDALKGKTVRVVIGSAGGNVGDAVARLYFKAMADLLPDTSVRVQNLPGAGGARAIKEVQEAGAGAVTLGFANNGPLYTHMLAPDKSAFGRLTVRWVGAFMVGQRVLVARKDAGIRSLADLKSRKATVRVGASEALEPPAIETYILNALLDLGVKVVPGMENAQLAALLVAGDVDVAIVGSGSMAEQFRAGALVPLLKHTDDDGVDFLRGVPDLSGLGGDAKARDVVAVMQSLIRIRNFVFAAPNTDTPTLQALRTAFDRVASDGQFRSQAARFDVGSPTPGRALEEALDGSGGNVGGHLIMIGDSARFYYECGIKMSDAGAKSCAR